MRLHIVFFAWGVFEIVVFAAHPPKYRLGSYDVQNVGHHEFIKANLDAKSVSQCPISDIDSNHNLSFNVVCGRKTKAPVIGACHWKQREARFEAKGPPMKGNQTVHCDCQVSGNRLQTVPTCSGLEIQGPGEAVLITGTSPKSLTVNVGESAEFWIEYILSNRSGNDSKSHDGHSFSITHWYNTVFSKGKWHIVYSYREADPSIQRSNHTSNSDHTPNSDPSSFLSQSINDQAVHSSGPWTINPSTIHNRVYRAHMRIDSAIIDESGIYTFEINYNQLSVISAFSLNIHSDDTRLQFFVRKSPPNASQSDYDLLEPVNSRFLQSRSTYEIVCAATIGDYDPLGGHPQTILSLSRAPCNKNPRGNVTCAVTGNFTLITSESFRGIDPANGRRFSYNNHGRHGAIIYTVEAIEPAEYQCDFSSNNSSKETADPIRFIPTDIFEAPEKRGIEIEVINATASHPDRVYDGDHVVLECRYQNIDYVFQRWQFIGDHGHAQTVIHNTSRYTLELSSSPFSSTGISRLTVQKADEERDSGKFICELIDLEQGGKAISVEKSIRIVSVVAPRFKYEEESTSIMGLIVNESESVTLKCLIEPDADPAPTVSWWKNGQLLSEFSDDFEVHFRRVVEEDEGNYSCVVANRAGIIQRNFLIDTVSMEVGNERTLNGSITAILVVLAGFVIVLAAVLAGIMTRNYIGRKRLTELHQQLTKAGTALDPNVAVNQQPENLPYDPQYEIRRDQLILGAILGEGQFGKVLDGYVFSEDKTRCVRVAVKIPKNGMDTSQQRMLLSEFKIMAYVGDHVNVVRLVAAITHRIPKGELYVASEYCHHGSLRDYLIRCRPIFQNELIIGSMDKNGYILSNDFIRQRRSEAVYPDLSPSLDTDPALIDDSTHLRTTDLLNLAFQVAHGMVYLSSRKIFHRDLALRNILLTKEMIVKISDFGLALNQLEEEKRDSNGERKKSNIPLPIKWMALESILYGQYTARSDVWSFGVVLWEIFSLGETPYPDKAPNMTVAEWLVAGHRLRPPKYAPEEIYHLMTQCWLEQPDERPSFSECRDRIGIDLQLRSQQAMEALQDLLNGYHSYVNVRGSLVNEDEHSPSAPLLEIPQRVLNHFQQDDDSGTSETMAVENPDYNRVMMNSPEAVENLNYSH